MAQLKFLSCERVSGLPWKFLRVFENQKADKGNIVILNRSDYIQKSEYWGRKSFESLDSYGRANNTSPQKFRRLRLDFYPSVSKPGRNVSVCQNP